MTDIDQTIQKLFDALAVRKKTVANIEAAAAEPWATHGMFTITPHLEVGKINIKTADEATLAYITMMIRVFEGATGPGEKYLNHTFSQWKRDIGKRESTAAVRVEKAKLEEIEAQLNTLLSPEERRRIEVERLSKKMGI